MSHPLLTGDGPAAVAAAMAETEPDSLAAASRLRASFAPDLAAAALGQAALRRRARAKFGEAAREMWFTPDGLEQASRPEVAAWRARRFVAAGVRRVVDLGCGIGADAMAFQAAGLEVIAVELEPATAALAQANLPGAQVIVGDATTVDSALWRDAALFVDPARRTERGRSWRLADFSPPWEFVLGLLASGRPACVKLGPGVPRELIPDDVAACWVSHRGDVVEAGLWRLPDEQPGSSALLLPGEHLLRSAPDAPRLPVRPPGRYLIEPDGAVIRARALNQLGEGLWLLDPEVAYLSSEAPLASPFATSFEILDELEFSEKALRAWVRQHEVGTLEIKKRAIEVDPAALRRRLKPRGPNSATLVLTRTPAGARAYVVRRVPASG